MVPSHPGSSVSSPPSTDYRPVRGGGGAQTVFNAERRATAGLPPPEVASPPNSGIWARLFPSESVAQEAGQTPVEAGLSLGHFAIEERIGAGGMGAVFRAKDLRLDRAVALKILTPSLSRDEAAVQRFRNEAKAAAQLDHENVARVYYIGEDQGLNFIAFEFITGQNLRNLISQHGRIEPAEAVNYVLQIASALRHTAANGVVHRDIKPSNLIITPSGRAKLVDLGLARKEQSESSPDLTLAGTTLGTFDYISPEQAKDPRNVDVRSDIYSLGCTLYHMLTGEPPYPEGTVLKKLLDHQSGEPPDPAKKNRRVSEELSVIVRKMMASDPKKRYQTPDQLIRDLMLIAGALGLRGVSPEGLIWLSSRPPLSEFWRQNAGVMAMAALLVLIVFGMSQFSNISTNRNNTSVNQVASDPTANSSLNQHSATTPSSTEPTTTSRPNDVAEPNSQVAAADVGTKPPGSEVDQTKSSSSASIPEGPTGLRPTELIPNTSPSVSDNVVSAPTKVERPDVPSPISLASRSPTETTTVAKSDTGTTPPRTDDFPPADSVRDPANVGDKPSVEKTTAAAEESQGIFVVAADGTTSKRFPTLEAACAAATDGSVISLRFNGRRAEKPLKLGKKNLTIRAARGFHPIIEFNPGSAPTDANLRLISIGSGPVKISQVTFEVTVPPFLAADRISLFGLERQDQLRLNGVVITLNNPGQRPTALFDLSNEPGQMLADMKMNSTGISRDPLELELTECFVRGQGDLALVRHTKPARITLRDTAVVLDGTFLRVDGNSEKPAEQSQLEVRLDHVTGRFGQHFVLLNSGDQPRELLPVKVTAHDNILTTTGNAAFVAMVGGQSDADFRKLFSWSGERNFHDRCQNFWTMASNTDLFSFDDWKAAWGANAVASNDKLLFQAEPNEWSKTSLESLQLDRQTESFNPAIGAAADGNDAGADVAKLARLMDSDSSK